MEDSNYVKSHAYEHYITQARQCGRDEYGARNSHMLNLMWKESGNNAVAHLKHDKLLSDAKKYLLSATKYAVKERKLEKADKDLLKSYLPRIEAATESGELLEICEEGWEVLLKYKPK